MQNKNLIRKLLLVSHQLDSLSLNSKDKTLKFKLPILTLILPIKNKKFIKLNTHQGILLIHFLLKMISKIISNPTIKNAFNLLLEKIVIFMKHKNLTFKTVSLNMASFIVIQIKRIKFHKNLIHFTHLTKSQALHFLKNN